MSDIENKIKKLGFILPKLPIPKYSYIYGRIVNNLVFVSGQTPHIDGNLLYKGKVDSDINIEDSCKAARLTVVNCIAELKSIVNDLERIKRIIQLSGFVASSKGFKDQPKVINSASELLIKIWGEDGEHTRKAIGVYELPGGAKRSRRDGIYH